MSFAKVSMLNLALPWLLLWGNLTVAEEATIAVASNFLGPMTALVERFEASSSHKLRVVYGSSGRLFAQISNAAPFDVFLSADKQKAAGLVKAGFGIADSEFTYAIGRLVLWSNRPLNEVEDLLLDEFRTIAIANPRLAPYGLAAKQSLETLKLWSQLESRLVQGENIAQTFQFVFTGNADAGFISMSQLVTQGSQKLTNYLIIPNEFHDAIIQNGVLLKRGSKNSAALEFMSFMQSESALDLIESYGYLRPSLNIASSK